ncbi:Gag-Pol polyprotein [Gossypium australe]|uniref:Gag-Pol polyprotein n=1 Tax=Gossypium australe TaxID=47621 RepID=A0A5B6VPU4_9ROSI|nr:Gag-Pol polyprotein [Gossypium australe]
MSRKNSSREQSARVEARAPARTYTIHASEDVSSPEVFTALIDPGSTHSYICMKLVSSMSMPIEPTKFVIRVSNPLGKYVLVDRVYKGCPLMITGNCFPVDLMFYVILGMDWLVIHDVSVNCGKKFIELKCEDGDLILVESDE